jgi:two-component system nitrate/nitrite sensor histidine kinase NarX
MEFARPSDAKNAVPALAGQPSRVEPDNPDWKSFFGLTAALARTLNAQEVVEVIINQGLVALDAQAGLVARLIAESAEVEIIGSLGYAKELVRDWNNLSLQTKIPLTEAIQTGQPIWLENLENSATAANYPRMIANRTIDPTAAVACVPLKIDQKIIGGLALSFSSPRTFSPQLKDFIVSLCYQCATALDRAYFQEERERLAGLEERNLLASDLHDGLAQTINLIGLKIQMARQLYITGNFGALDTELAQLDKIAQSARQDVREVLYGLSRHAESLTLPEMLADLVHRYAEQGTGTIRLVAKNAPAWPSLNITVQTQLLRIVQEALSNLQKYSQASQAHLEVEYLAESGQFKLKIEDNGVGFDLKAVSKPAKTEVHLGLNIMQERAARIGATLRIETAPGEGTVIFLVYPANGSLNQPGNPEPGRSALP